MPDDTDFSLRPMDVSDLDRVLRWRNRADVKAYMFTDADISVDEHAAWFDRTLHRDDVDYQIVEYQNTPVGLANAIDIDGDECHWGFYLGEPDLPKGSGSALARLMLKHIFDTHKVRRIHAEVFEFNIASLKLHEKFGFTRQDSASRTVTKNDRPEKVIALTLDHAIWLQRQNTDPL